MNTFQFKYSNNQQPSLTLPTISGDQTYGIISKGIASKTTYTHLLGSLTVLNSPS